MEKDCAPEKAYFIMELTRDLSRITRGHERLEMIKYLLDMIMVEAQEIVEDSSPRAPSDRVQSYT